MTREEFCRYQEQTFDSFTKMVLRNKSIDILREYRRQTEREVPLEDITQADMYKNASINDTYRLYRKAYSVRNYVVWVYDPVIGELLQHLTPQRREVILLYYFLDFNDSEIARLLRIDNTTVKYRRNTALKLLKKMMEDTENG